MADSIENYKRVVVDGRWDGNLIPGRMEELLREVIVRPGSKVIGCVFGSLVRIEGPAEIGKSVYATRDLELVPVGDIRLFSSAGAKEMLITAGGPGRVIVEGDVVARNVKMTRCVVRGSIHAEEVRLQDSVVLGAVHGSRIAEMSGSTVLTAYGDEIVFGQGCGLILPYARASRSLRVETPVRLVAVDSADAVLGWEDTVPIAGHLHLNAGRRLTALAKVHTYLRNVGNFLFRFTVADAQRLAPGRFEFDPSTLPSAFHCLLEIDQGAEAPI